MDQPLAAMANPDDPDQTQEEASICTKNNGRPEMVRRNSGPGTCSKSESPPSPGAHEDSAEIARDAHRRSSVQSLPAAVATTQQEQHELILLDTSPSLHTAGSGACSNTATIARSLPDSLLQLGDHSGSASSSSASASSSPFIMQQHAVTAVKLHGASSSNTATSADAGAKAGYECQACGKQLCSTRSLKRHRATCKRLKVQMDGENTAVAGAPAAKKAKAAPPPPLALKIMQQQQQKPPEKTPPNTASPMHSVIGSGATASATTMMMNSPAILQQQHARIAVAAEMTPTAAAQPAEVQFVPQHAQHAYGGGLQRAPMFAAAPEMQSPNAHLQPVHAVAEQQHDELGGDKVSDVVDSVVARLRQQQNTGAATCTSARNAAGAQQVQLVQQLQQRQQWAVAQQQQQAVQYSTTAVPPPQQQQYQAVQQQQELQMQYHQRQQAVHQQQQTAAGGAVAQQPVQVRQAQQAEHAPTAQPVQAVKQEVPPTPQPAVQVARGEMELQQQQQYQRQQLQQLQSATPKSAPAHQLQHAPPPFWHNMPQPPPMQAGRNMHDLQHNQMMSSPPPYHAGQGQHAGILQSPPPHSQQSLQQNHPQQQVVELLEVGGQLEDTNTAAETAKSAAGAPQTAVRNVYRYLCPECDKPYSCRKNVKRHRVSQHKVSTQEAHEGQIQRIKISEQELQAQKDAEKAAAAAASANKLQQHAAGTSSSSTPSTVKMVEQKPIKKEEIAMVKTELDPNNKTPTNAVGISHPHNNEPGEQFNSPPPPSMMQQQHQAQAVQQQQHRQQQQLQHNAMYAMGGPPPPHSAPLVGQQPQFFMPPYPPQHQQQFVEQHNNFEQYNHQHYVQQQQQQYAYQQHRQAVVQQQQYMQQQQQQFGQHQVQAVQHQQMMGYAGQPQQHVQYVPGQQPQQQFYQQPPQQPQYHQLQRPAAGASMSDAYTDTLDCWELVRSGEAAAASTSSTHASAQNAGAASNDAAVDAMEMARIVEDLKRTEEVTEQRHRARIEQQRRQAGGTFFTFGPLAPDEGGAPRTKAVELAEADTTFSPPSQSGAPGSADDTVARRMSMSMAASSSACTTPGVVQQQQQFQAVQQQKYGSMMMAGGGQKMEVLAGGFVVRSAGGVATQPPQQMFMDEQQFHHHQVQAVHQHQIQQLHPQQQPHPQQLAQHAHHVQGVVQQQPQPRAQPAKGGGQEKGGTTKKGTRAPPAHPAPYSCPHCNRGLSTDYSLKRHRQCCPKLVDKSAGGKKKGGTGKAKAKGASSLSLDEHHQVVDPDSTMNESPPEEGAGVRAASTSSSSTTMTMAQQRTHH